MFFGLSPHRLLSVAAIVLRRYICQGKFLHIQSGALVVITSNMNTFAIMGFALLCLSQVHGEHGDLLHSLFNEKTRELKSEKLPETGIFLAADPVDPLCNANEVMLNGTTLMKNTLDIVQETFQVVYTARYPSSGTSNCDYFGTTVFGKFRCFLLEFNDVKKAIADVSDKVGDYKKRSADLLTGIRYYMKNCINKI
uniref:Uncharacterized protein n=1 Tax=Lygus hesperus TaxID=30085 RepID=A0A146M3Q7_LYGHE